MKVYVYENMIGKVFDNVVQVDDEVHFYNNGDLMFKLFHEQDCCENVYIESIVGDLNDLTNNPITLAEVVYKNNHDQEDLDDCYDLFQTWSFFKFATVKGYADIRFFGSSNGYYSETADLKEYSNED